MIFLTKGQQLIEQPGLVVYDPTGYYEDDASITCASVLAPDEPLFKYEARFVAYGGMVYAITNEEELMKQVMKLDAKSLFGKKRTELSPDELLNRAQKEELREEVAPDVREEVPETPRSGGGVVVPPRRVDVSSDTPPVSAGPTKDITPADTAPVDATVKEYKTEIIDAVLDAVAPEPAGAVDPGVSGRKNMKKIAKVVKTVTKKIQKNKKIV